MGYTPTRSQHIQFVDRLHQVPTKFTAPLMEFPPLGSNRETNSAAEIFPSEVRVVTPLMGPTPTQSQRIQSIDK